MKSKLTNLNNDSNQSGLRRSQSGFTIIEVLIVLAIAGLILLIVFLAVPALQRSSRTTQAKNAAASILSTASEYVANNNGGQPTTCNLDISDGTITISGSGSDATGRTQGGYTCTTGGGAKSAGDPTGDFSFNPGQKCNGTALTSAPRAVAVAFTVETSTSTVPQCIDG